MKDIRDYSYKSISSLLPTFLLTEIATRYHIVKSEMVSQSDRQCCLSILICKTLKAKLSVCFDMPHTHAKNNDYVILYNILLQQ